MNITQRDFWWLSKHQPLLTAGLGKESAEGILEISAYYDRDLGQVFSSQHITVRSHNTFIADRFAIRIEFDANNVTEWPKVYETGLRYRLIARRYEIPVEDLHFYPTGEACLGLDYPWDPAFTLEYFLTEIVEPFFYRLAYVDLYGLTATRTNLWPEYSHGIAGLIEHQEDVRQGLRARQSSKTWKKRARASLSR